ncbi:hypothetical protein MBAV_004954 [Candidatus Magnetobacterium bavaricum]|uniref:Uncharacterized protein n=1 Tax=Candidatus Magnetobacterium bavaricum TaxID=29290 RepID=A0A0F3GLR0_9BACT|nr:hypothetical protein MBAV_004954 [Candidatus Magnetobacterium bavaricum]
MADGLSEIETPNNNDELSDSDYDEFFKLAGIMDSGLGDLAENHDNYLYGNK